MTVKQELKLIEKSIMHLADSLDNVSELITKEKYEYRVKMHENTRDRLLNDIRILTKTIAQMQAPKIEVKSTNK